MNPRRLARIRLGNAHQSQPELTLSHSSSHRIPRDSLQKFCFLFLVVPYEKTTKNELRTTEKLNGTEMSKPTTWINAASSCPRGVRGIDASRARRWLRVVERMYDTLHPVEVGFRRLGTSIVDGDISSPEKCQFRDTFAVTTIGKVSYR